MCGRFTLRNCLNLIFDYFHFPQFKAYELGAQRIVSKVVLLNWSL